MKAMDVAPQLQQQLVFHLTGKRAGPGLEPIEGLGLRPALFARFHDLTRLRYDFPLVLLEEAPEGEFVTSLSGAIDAALQKIAPQGLEGERLRRNVLRLEREIRSLLQEGAGGRLSDLWQEAAAQLAARGGEAVKQDLERARAALGIDGRLLDCDAALPEALAGHAWHTVQEAKTRVMRRRIEALIVRLSDLVKADHLRSGEGRTRTALEAGVGGAHRGLFDFAAMARLLAAPSGASALPESRRRRIDGVLSVLRAQRLFAGEAGHSFRFDDAHEAIDAYRRRRSEAALLLKAMKVGELEAEGRYVEAKHDALFDGYGADSPGAEELALFPDYLVCRKPARGAAGRRGDAARAVLIEALSSGAPLKVLLEAGDLLEESLAGGDRVSLGAQLAHSAMGLGDVYVLQSAASNLYRMRGRLLDAMRHPGAALLSVYSGARADAPSDGPPPYLVAAAAMQARVFPAFSYDPGAGADWAARFSLEDNPQPGETWPRHELAWADQAEQRVTQAVPFTLADFAACDARCAKHFARVPREHWDASMVPLGEWLAREPSGAPESVPFVYAVDAGVRLQRLVVDDKLVRAARRCAEAWGRLQELERLKQKGAAAVPEAKPAAEAKPEVQEKKVLAAEKPAAEERVPGDAYIETERCSSCNECTNLNNVMFAYNENKQAYIAKPDGGTFREMVEAAEACQVAIIHPGKPRNPKEPGLEELVARAAPFQ